MQKNKSTKNLTFLSQINSSKFAFTLSEVLITLGIIGVITAITIPILIKEHKKYVTVQKLKVAYSIFSQAFEAAKNEYGDVIYWNSSLSNKELAEKYFLPYLNHPQIIKTKSNDKLFMHTLWGENKTRYLHTPSNMNADNDPVYGLNNGMAFHVANLIENGTFKNKIFITVDINGSNKGPNILGHDGFVFTIATIEYYNLKRINQLLPEGIELNMQELFDTSKGGACSKNGTWMYYDGAYCGATIMKNNWEIPDNYPW